MNSRLIISLALGAILLVPTTAAFAGSEESATVAKKKLSYCQKQGKKQKGKLFGKVKSAKFFLYTKKKPTEYFFCSESPKYYGTIPAWDGIKKTSNLKAIKNNCAIFYSEGTPVASDLYSGEKELKMVSAKFFKKGAVKQTNASRLGTKDQTVSVESLSLVSNCTYAVGYLLNGVPTMIVSGTGDFPYTGRVERTLTGATAAELKAIKIVANSPTESVVTWTQGGVAKSLTYTSTGVK